MSKRTPAPRRPSAAEIAEAQRQNEAAHRGLQRVQIRQYVAKLPESRQREYLAGIMTPNMVQNTVPDPVLRALDGEGNRRFQAGERLNASRAAVLRDAILERQNSRRRW